MKRELTIKPGHGYWNTTQYPIGGKFCRVDNDSKGLVVFSCSELSRPYKGADLQGTTATGESVAFGADVIY